MSYQRKMMLNITVLVSFVFILVLSSNSHSYYENYPPYEFRQGSYKHVNAKELKDEEIPLFIKKNSDLSVPHKILKADINGNNLDDFIVFLLVGASPLITDVDIYLQKPEGSYQKISIYEDAGAGIEDFVDLNQDGKCEVIITNLYHGSKHNYLTYSVYEFKGYKLVNADKNFKGFPKFVWMTYKPNDKDTIHLSDKEKLRHIEEKNQSIQNELVSP